MKAVRRLMYELDSLLQEKNLDWFPYLRCMSLSVEETENEQNEIRSLQGQLEATSSLVHTLSRQLAELRDQVDTLLTFLISIE